MNTDRELLELAAKAAGYLDCKYLGWLEGDEWWQVFDGEEWFRWNPRDNDGDALRLAVKLNLQINPTIHTDFGPASTAYDGSVGISTVQHSGDGSIATREAIVRAAAEIGKDMK